MNKQNRRSFLKTGAVGVAGLALAPGLLNLITGCTNQEQMKNELMSHFEVTEEMMKRVMSMALSRGGDYTDLFFEHKISNNISLQDNTVNRAGSNIDYGMGVRVLKGDQTGYAYTEDVSLQAMEKVAKTAGSIANQPNTVEPIDLTNILHPNYYKVQTAWEKVSIEEKIPFLKKLNDKVFSLDKRVSKVSVYYNDVSSFVLFANSEGKLFSDYRPLVSLNVVCVMEENGKKENFFCGRSLRQGSEFLTEELLNTLANELVEKTALQFKAGKPIAGEMPVVLGAGGSGILLHEAIGHTFEADFNRKKTSIFCDKMGQSVAEDFVNIVDDGTNISNRGALNIDDEGNATEKTYMVKDGKLNSYLHDRLSAQHYNLKPTGNGRRQSFRHMPMPRMRNTYMENGPHTREDIIASVENGIYVDNFSNGEVKIGAGDFTFYVKSGYLIENGKLTRPIKDINLIGNGPQALADITMCADDLKMDHSTWNCGKSGQTAAVGLGMPTVKLAKLTVGGVSS